MANTTNFNWETPDDTDLVKDGAAAIRTLGSAIDTSLVDLKGGTTGQILSKATNTDMDFTWITNDVGDITAVTAGTGISGGGTSGAVTITNSMATEIAAKGDLIVGTGSATFDNLTVGTNGHVLTADSSTATGLKWAAAAGGGGKVLQVVQGSTTTQATVASTTFTDTNLTATITPSATTSKILVFFSQQMTTDRASTPQGGSIRLLRGATEVYTQDGAGGGYGTFYANPTTLSAPLANTFNFYAGGTYLDSPSTTSATTYKTQGRAFATGSSGNVVFQNNTSTSTIILMEIGA